MGLHGNSRKMKREKYIYIHRNYIVQLYTCFIIDNASKVVQIKFLVRHEHMQKQEKPTKY